MKLAYIHIIRAYSCFIKHKKEDNIVLYHLLDVTLASYIICLLN